MRTPILAALGLATALIVTQPSPVSADWMFTPFIGVTTGGSVLDISGRDLNDRTKTTFGGGLTYMGGGVFGMDIDFGYAPDFFGDDPDFEDSNLTTLMFNFVLGVPLGGQHGFGIRPYALGGFGLLRQRVTSAVDLFDDVSRNDWGFDAGGGVLLFFTDTVGVRGDLRYFRKLREGSDPENAMDIFDVDRLTFWRTTGGVTFRF